MSQVREVMNGIRQYIEKLTADEGPLDEALGLFAESVVAEARKNAPVRKAYKTPGKRRSSRELTAEEYTTMGQAAAKLTWRDKSGRIQRGALNPNIGIVRKRHLNSSNDVTSPERVVGKVESRWRKKTIGAKLSRVSVLKNDKSGKAYISHPSKSKITLQTTNVRSPRFMKTMNMNINVKLRKDPDTGEVIIDSVTRVGQNLLKKMNARQRYDILHGRSLHVSGGKFGWGGKIVIGGALRDSIAADHIGHLKYRVAANIRYARYVEFGTFKDNAQPFMLPALMWARHRMARDIAMGTKG
jgi:hypothetical protein